MKSLILAISLLFAVGCSASYEHKVGIKQEKVTHKIKLKYSEVGSATEYNLLVGGFVAVPKTYYYFVLDNNKTVKVNSNTYFQYKEGDSY